MADLRAVLQGVDEGLEDALEDVAQASEAVGKSLDDLDETLNEISVAMEGAQEAAEDATEGLNDTSQAAQGTDRAVSQVSDEFRNAIGEVRLAAESLDEAARSFVNVGATAEAAETGVDRMADESREATGSNMMLMQANELLSGSNIQTALTSDRAKEGIQDMGNAANNATGDLVGAASASELLNLQTSALSINVGAFTIALRNLTTEIPALVATLGNLSAGLFGVAGAFTAVGGAAAALTLGGFLAQAEQLAGPLEGAGNHLEAMGDIADNLKDIFIEAIQPLLETEGVIQVFRNAIEDVANIVQSFAEVIQYTFEESFENVDGVQLQSLAETMKGISDAIMDNIDEITAAIGDMVVQLGDDVVGIMQTLFEALPGFIRGITVVTEELIAIFGSATDSAGRFTSELMELGRSIAAGVAPVLDTFFSIVADTAEVINSLGAENIATAAKMATLLLAVNRLAGIIGSLILPITQVTGNLIKFATEAENAFDAFIKTARGAAQVSTNLSSGIGGLATAFEQVLPPIGESTSLLDNLANSSDESGSALSSFGTLLDGVGLDTQKLSQSIPSVTTNYSSLFSVLQTAGVDSLQSVAEGTERLRNSLRESTGVIDLFTSAGGSALTAMFGAGSPVDSAINQTASAIGSLSSPIISTIDSITPSIDSGTALFDQLDSAARGAANGVTQAVLGMITGVGRVGRMFVDAAEKSIFFTNALKSLTDIGSVSDAFVDEVIELADDAENVALKRFDDIAVLEGLSLRSMDLNPNKGINNALKQIYVDPVKETLSESITGIKEFVSDTRSLLGRKFVEAFVPAKNAFDDVSSAISSTLSDPLTTIADGPLAAFENAVIDSMTALVKMDSASDLVSPLTAQFDRLGESAGLSRFGVTSLSDALKGLGAESLLTSGSVTALEDNLEDLVGKTQISDTSVGELSDELQQMGVTSDLSEQQLNDLEAELSKISEDGQIAKMSLDELNDELTEAGVKSEITEQQLDGMNDEMTNTSIKAGITSTAMNGLAFSISTVVKSAAVLVAGFGALVIAVGAAGAILQKVGESGKSAKEILQSLKDTVVNVGKQAMPFVVESTELMMDVFNSLMAVGKALVSAFSDIAVELGLIQEPLGSGEESSKSFADTVGELATTIGDFLDKLGKVARIIAGKLIVAIRNASDAFVSFLDTINAEEIINGIANSLGALGEKLDGMELSMETVINITSDLISALVKIAAIIAIVGTVFGIATMGVVGFTGALLSTIGLLLGITAPISGTVAAILALVAVITIALERLGVFDAILSLLQASFQAIMAVINPLIGVLVTLVQKVYEFSLIGEVISFAADAFGMLQSAIGPVTNLLTTILSVFGKMANAILNLLVGTAIAGAIAGFGALIGILNSAIGVITNVLSRIPLLSGVLNRVGSTVNSLANSFTGLISTIQSIPQIATGVFQKLLDGVQYVLNKMVNFINGFINTFNNSAGRLPGVKKIDKLDEVKIGKDGQRESVEDAIGGAGSAAKDARPDPASADSDAIGSGYNTAQNAKDAVAPGRNPDVTVDEGDTTNVFNQNISANPEDKAQIGRIAKDAMEEANSFKRRQQGGQ